MPSLSSYKGLQVVDPAAGAGGAALTGNFKATVDWHPKSEWSKTTDPSSSNNASSDYYPGSWWLNYNTSTSSGRLFLCVLSSTSSATWHLVVSW